EDDLPVLQGPHVHLELRAPGLLRAELLRAGADRTCERARGVLAIDAEDRERAREAPVEELLAFHARLILLALDRREGIRSIHVHRARVDRDVRLGVARV